MWTSSGWLCSTLRFEEFRRERDLHHASHQGITSKLIPRWLQAGPATLDGNIESSAYGETPEALISRITKSLALSPEDTFLDLGAGAGNIVAAVLAGGNRAVGLERNPNLVTLGQEFLTLNGIDSEVLRLSDFLVDPWPPANKLFAASSRFGESTLQKLAIRLNNCTSVEAITFLGRSPDLRENWELSSHSTEQVIWNQDEPPRAEPLKTWIRTSLNDV